MKRRGAKSLFFLLLFFPLFVFTFSFNGFGYPIDGESRISLRLGGSWKSNSGKSYNGHLGEDMIIPAGNPVFAVADGLVVVSNKWSICDKYETINGLRKKTQDSHGWGGVLIIRHDVGDQYSFSTESAFLKNSDSQTDPSVVFTQYGHLTNIPFEVGAYVKKGDYLGEIASMCMWAPHLHFEIKDEVSFKNDILGGVGSGYSGKDNHAPHRYEPTKFIDLNKDLIIKDNTVDQKDLKKQEFHPFHSLWEKIKSIFVGDSPDKDGVEVKGEKIENGENEVKENKIEVESKDEPIFNAIFSQTKTIISGVPGTETQITLQVQNTGNTLWKSRDISLNVVGGREINQKYRHRAWITDLRPAGLVESTVQPQSFGTFTFPIQIPVETGETRLVLQIVRQEGANFVQVGDVTTEITIRAESTVSEHKNPEMFLINTEKIQEQTQKTIQKIGDVLDNIVDGAVKGMKIFVDSIPAPLVLPQSGLGDGGVGSVEPQPEEEIQETLPEIVPLAPVESPGDIPVVVGENSPSTSPVITHIVVNKLDDDADPAIHVSWQFGDAEGDINYFQLQQKNGENEWGVLSDYVTSTDFFVFADREREYIFRVRGVDQAGNIGDWSAESGSVTFALPRSVVISEIAWMGTGPGPGAADEWLELYNTTDHEVDISGWKLHLNGQEILWTKTKSAVPAQGYFVLERGSDMVLSNVSAGGFFQVAGGLPDQGGKLELFDSEGNLIEKIDAEAGWFAGSRDLNYRSMYRVQSLQAGDQVDSWSSTDFASPITTGRGGVPIFGSPGLSNDGAVLLKSILPYALHLITEDKVLRLTSKYGPYFIDGAVEIPVGYTLSIEEGVVLTGMHQSSYLNVKGNLILLGTKSDPVIFTSALDSRYVRHNFSSVVGDTPHSGDWSHIEIASTGRMKGDSVHFLYGGYPYSRGNGWVYGNKEFAQVITNFGGQLELDNSRFEQSLVHNRDADYNSVIWLQKNSQTLINNSTFVDGFVAVKQDDLSNFLGNNNLFQGFQYSDGPVSLEGQAVVGENNTFVDNVFNGMSLRRTVIDGTVVLPAKSKYVASNIDITPTGHLTLQSGTQLLMRARADIKVRGQLSILGQLEQRVEIKPVATGTYWGSLFFDGSTSTLQFATLIGGNHSTVDSGRDNGMVQIQNSIVDFEQIQLLDARRPYNMVFAKNSTIVFANSRVAWSVPKENRNWLIAGVKLDGGAIFLDNTLFQHLDRGIDTVNNVTGTMRNIIPTHFVDVVQKPWHPDGLFAF